MVLELNNYCYLSITNSINAVQDYAVIRLSTTGFFVFVICGTTCHSMLHLTINRPYNLLTGSRLQESQECICNTKAIIIDKYYMMGQKMINTIDKRLTEASGYL